MILDRWGKEIKFYDDFPFDTGKVFAYGNEFGIIGIIRAQSWETAFEIAHDEFLTPIPPEEVADAFDGDDLVEGYAFQANSTGTGIVEPGHYEWMEEFTVEQAARFELTCWDIPNVEDL